MLGTMNRKADPGTVQGPGHILTCAHNGVSTQLRGDSHAACLLACRYRPLGYAIITRHAPAFAGDCTQALAESRFRPRAARQLYRLRVQT